MNLGHMLSLLFMEKHAHSLKPMSEEGVKSNNIFLCRLASVAQTSSFVAFLVLGLDYMRGAYNMVKSLTVIKSNRQLQHLLNSGMLFLMYASAMGCSYFFDVTELLPVCSFLFAKIENTKELVLHPGFLLLVIILYSIQFTYFIQTDRIMSQNQEKLQMIGSISNKNKKSPNRKLLMNTIQQFMLLALFGLHIFNKFDFFPTQGH